jgi:hypothetical protein
MIPPVVPSGSRVGGQCRDNDGLWFTRCNRFIPSQTNVLGRGSKAVGAGVENLKVSGRLNPLDNHTWTTQSDLRPWDKTKRGFMMY